MSSASRSGGLAWGAKGSSAELAALVVGDDAHQIGDVERAVHPVDVEHRIDVDGLGEPLHAGLDALAHADSHPHAVAAVAAAQLGLDGLEEILALLLVDLQVPVAGDAEGVGAAQAGRGEEVLHVAGR